MHDEARRYFERIELRGGMLAAVETGFFRREIAEAAYQYQQSVDRDDRVIVGVNRFTQAEEAPVETLQVDPSVEALQIESLRRVKAARHADDVDRVLSEIRRAAETGVNTFPALIEAARARATVGEIVRALADVLGRQTLHEQ
jgi:methylmalonyl-CoA mutase N-terminal domain/subunit